mmetsp:Transcript_35980/g.56275  ORF Transcript_35980/g.56275 Transcript_35980/m.56275 type:complete len:214 (-) Transcript_35980:2172-2813(-)
MTAQRKIRKRKRRRVTQKRHGSISHNSRKRGLLSTNLSCIATVMRRKSQHISKVNLICFEGRESRSPQALYKPPTEITLVMSRSFREELHHSLNKLGGFNRRGGLLQHLTVMMMLLQDSLDVNGRSIQPSLLHWTQPRVTIRRRHNRLFFFRLLLVNKRSTNTKNLDLSRFASRSNEYPTRPPTNTKGPRHRMSMGGGLVENRTRIIIMKGLG